MKDRHPKRTGRYLCNHCHKAFATIIQLRYHERKCAPSQAESEEVVQPRSSQLSEESNPFPRGTMLRATS
jgi:hypothetical protein